MKTWGALWSSHPTQDTSLPLASPIRQIDGLQMLRAIAVILVVWFHAGLDDSRSRPLPNLGIFGIDVFFVISGFILSLAVLKERRQPGFRSMWEFLKRRLIRIYPIYWVIALLTLARLARSHQLLKRNYLPAFFLLPSVHYPSDSYILRYSWTMMFEMFFYLLLSLILLKTTRWAVPTLIVLLSASVGIGSIAGIRHPFWNVASNPILLEFVFGAAIALLYVRFGCRCAWGRCLAAAGAIASIGLQMRPLPAVASGSYMILVNQGAFSRVGTWGICAALIVSGIVFWSPSMKSASGKWSVLMGNASYSAYLISALVLEYATRLSFRLAPPPHGIWSGLAYQLSMVIAVLAAGFGCYVVIEKPMLRVLQAKLLHRNVDRSQNPAEIIQAPVSAPSAAQHS